MQCTTTTVTTSSGEGTSDGHDGLDARLLPLLTVRQFLNVNKLSYSEGHAALTLSCLLCERETSQTATIPTYSRQHYFTVLCYLHDTSVCRLYGPQSHTYTATELVHTSHWYLPLVLTGAVSIGLGGEAVPEVGSEEAGDSRAAEQRRELMLVIV